ncbi:hypothetical protein HK100_008692 [Physocladia obscura]|uniref:Uncharacterized protein n=1 Tax=Physocladia obscura TaxID=109957 RepID=A0AAD5SQ63_9FUNG|nr:hypothetical protein HK100_008692 [Physocladia obscura]
MPPIQLTKALIRQQNTQVEASGDNFKQSSTKVFVSLELPKELINFPTTRKTRDSQKSELTETKKFPYSSLPGYTAPFFLRNDDHQSFEANAITKKVQPRQYYSEINLDTNTSFGFGFPVLKRSQSQKSELERLNRIALYRDMDGEGRPIVSQSHRRPPLPLSRTFSEYPGVNETRTKMAHLFLRDEENSYSDRKKETKKILNASPASSGE